MVFNGRYQYLCSNGHYWQSHAHDPSKPLCPACNLEPEVYNLIDDTNGDSSEVQFEEVGLEEMTCSSCQGSGQIIVPIYKVPKSNEKVAYVRYNDYGDLISKGTSKIKKFLKNKFHLPWDK